MCPSDDRYAVADVKNRENWDDEEPFQWWSESDEQVCHTANGRGAEHTLSTCFNGGPQRNDSAVTLPTVANEANSRCVRYLR